MEPKNFEDSYVYYSLAVTLSSGRLMADGLSDKFRDGNNKLPLKPWRLDFRLKLWAYLDNLSQYTVVVS